MSLWLAEQLEVIPTQVEEDYTSSHSIPVAPGIRWIQPWSIDSFGSVNLLGTLDENEIWINPNQPLIRSYRFIQQWAFELEQFEISRGLPDENEIWQNPLQPIAYGRLYQPLPAIWFAEQFEQFQNQIEDEYTSSHSTPGWLPNRWIQPSSLDTSGYCVRSDGFNSGDLNLNNKNSLSH